MRRGATRPADALAIAMHRRKVQARAARLASQLGEEAAATIIYWKGAWLQAADDYNADKLTVLANAASSRAHRLE